MDHCCNVWFINCHQTFGMCCGVDPQDHMPEGSMWWACTTHVGRWLSDVPGFPHKRHVWHKVCPFSWSCPQNLTESQAQAALELIHCQGWDNSLLPTDHHLWKLCNLHPIHSTHHHTIAKQQLTVLQCRHNSPQNNINNKLGELISPWQCYFAL